MKRRAMKLLLLLLAGAIINVAVAWGCAFYPGERGSVVHKKCFDQTDGTELFVADLRRWALWRVSCTRNREAVHLYPPPHYVRLDDVLPSWSRFRTHMNNGSYDSWSEFAYGWPRPSLYCGDTHKSSALGFSPIPLGNRHLPIDPIFPGFAINTIFYAAVLWVLFAVPGRVRRWLRIKRGQCASCGYSLRGSVSEQCPECGRRPDFSWFLRRRTRPIPRVVARNTPSIESLH